LSPEVVDRYQSQIIAHKHFESPPLFQGPRLLVTAPLHKPALETLAMPMEPNRTRQVIQDLARAFNKLASELTADLSYAAREIDSLRKEVQRVHPQPRAIEPMEVPRNQRLMEPRQVVQLTKTALPIR
jgi:hypothetical protein